MAPQSENGSISSAAPEVQYESFEVRMAFQAGYAQYREWTSGTTFHSGIGYFHPFGQCRYYMGDTDIAEAKNFPLSGYFSEGWEKDFCEMGFAIYRLPDGDIYAYDGIFGALIKGTEGLGLDVPSFRNDILINVVVGGTGRYEGAVGILSGTAEGSGDAKEVKPGFFLPEGLLKLLSGYIKIPVKG